MKKRLVKEKVTYCDLCDRDMTSLVQIQGLYWCGQLITFMSQICPCHRKAIAGLIQVIEGEWRSPIDDDEALGMVDEELGNCTCQPKPECDHIVGLRNIYHITNGIQPGFIEVHDSDIAGKYMMNYLFKDCPECGEKLNLKKDL